MCAFRSPGVGKDLEHWPHLWGFSWKRGKISKTMGNTESSIETPVRVVLCSWLTAVDSPELINESTVKIQWNFVVSCHGSDGWLSASRCRGPDSVCGPGGWFLASYCTGPN